MFFNDKKLTYRFSYLTIFSARNLNETTLFRGADSTNESDQSALADNSIMGPIDDEEQNSLPAKAAKKISMAELCAWGNEHITGDPEVSYGIRTDESGNICTITVPRTRLHAGNVIRILLSFVNCTQGCERVRATLIQQEKRLMDGVMLKVKILLLLIYDFVLKRVMYAFMSCNIFNKNYDHQYYKILTYI